MPCLWQHASANAVFIAFFKKENKIFVAFMSPSCRFERLFLCQNINKRRDSRCCRTK
nr:MAG TPA: hypothetical protein [Bacteriophage sp.]